MRGMAGKFLPEESQQPHHPPQILVPRRYQLASLRLTRLEAFESFTSWYFASLSQFMHSRETSETLCSQTSRRGNVANNSTPSVRKQIGHALDALCGFRLAGGGI